MTSPSSNKSWELGAVENEHVLTAAGWLPLRWLPAHASPPYYPGDVINGHVFTGREWVAIPAGRPTTQPNHPGASLAAPKALPWLPWTAAGIGLALVLGVGIVVLGGLNTEADRVEASTSDIGTEESSGPAEREPAPAAKAESEAPKKPEKRKPAPPPEDPNRVVIDGMWLHDDVSCEYNGYSATVTGTITNQSGSAKDYVQVSFGLYDASGALLGNAFANVTNLAAGASWKYEAVGMVGQFEKCNPEEISAY